MRTSTSASSRIGPSSPQQKPFAELVVGLEHELVPAGQVGTALDLGDDALGGFLDHPAGELAADDAAVEERLVRRDAPFAVQQREPRGSAAPARGAVDLPVGENGDVPLGERILALVLPEDDAVDAAKLRLARVDDLVLLLE